MTKTNRVDGDTFVVTTEGKRIITTPCHMDYSIMSSLVCGAKNGHRVVAEFGDKSLTDITCLFN